MILVKNEDKTSQIRSWRYDDTRPLVHVVFHSDPRKTFTYRRSEFEILHAVSDTDVDGCLVFIDGEPEHGARRVQCFERYTKENRIHRILYANRSSKLFFGKKIKIVASVLRSPIAKLRFSYLHDLAVKTGLIVGEINPLAMQYENLTFVREDSALAPFLLGYDSHSESNSKEVEAIYPFGFNLSQKKAVQNALRNRISVIEGPPGTGKTQTILNIIANAVKNNESVAVVSSNNAATANVYEKLKSNGFDFFAAPLGSVSNKEAFIDAQTTELPMMVGWQRVAEGLTDIGEKERELDGMLRLQNELSAIVEEQSTLEKEHQHFGDFFEEMTIKGKMPRFSSKKPASAILKFIAMLELSTSSGGKSRAFSAAHHVLHLWLALAPL